MKKLSNKILLTGLVVLVGIFAASRFFRSPGLESNLRKNLLTLDTAKIDEIKILPSKERTEELRLVREGNLWKVIKGTRQEPASKSSVKNLLSSLNMEAQQMVSRKKEKWEEFNVGNNSTHVTVFNEGNKLADFHIGKLGFTQSSGGGFGGSYTYVRLSDEDQVYSVDGFLEPTFNSTFNDWRDKTLSKLNKEDVIKLSFNYPADSGFVVEKRDSVWYTAADKVDPSKIENLLNLLAAKYASEFAEDFTPTSLPTATLQIDGKVGNLLRIEAWKKDEAEWILSSSQQKGIYFSDKGSSATKDVFVGRKKMLP